MLFDNHNHSQFSFDGRTSVEASAKAAAEKGLGGICFTDHCDFYVPRVKENFERTVPEEFDVDAQQAEIDRLQGKFGGLRIFKGIEIGLGEKNHEKTRKLFKEKKFDEVIASVHYLEDQDPFWGGYYKGKTFKEAYGTYLETLYKEAVWLGDFDILGHYDYVARYAPYPQESVLYKDFPDLWDTILKYLAENGKSLEINTKTYQEYKGGRTPKLDLDILRRYRELGGEAISLGSDSHNPERVADKFGLYSEILRDNGFPYLAHYEGRKLVMEPTE
jgi:histidinol-phosphatase (PHP family)